MVQRKKATAVIRVTTGTNGHPTEFAGKEAEFAVGEMWGVRMWRPDAFGRLRARNIDWVGWWEPGVNSAMCAQRITFPNYQYFKDPTGRGRQVHQVDYTSLSGFRIVWSDGTTDVYNYPPVDHTTHRPPDDECQCGFYAYTHPDSFGFDLQARYGGLISGVVKAWGRVLIGSHGFRAEKAQIVALHVPDYTGRRNPWVGSTMFDPPLFDPTEQVPYLAHLTEQIGRHYPGIPIMRAPDELLEKYPPGPR